MGASGLLGGLLLISGPAAAPALIVYAERAEGERACTIEVQRRRLTPDALLAVARRWRGRRAIVVTGSDTPYRCVGGVVFTLQRAGFEAIEYRAGSPPALIERALALPGVTVDPKGTCIHLNRRTAFAGLHPRRSALLLNLRTSAPIESSRIRKIERASATSCCWIRPTPSTRN